MSAETMEVLNTRQKVGFGHKAWWYMPELENADAPSHYPGAIPVADIERDLFGWRPMEATLSATAYDPSTPDGIEPVALHVITDGNRKAIIRPPGAFGPNDPGAILGVFKSGYQIHLYMEWLIKNVELITSGDTLGIASAGVLREGAQAYASFGMPETMKTAEGIEFRPYLGSCTSLDGTLASDYFRCVQLPLCDNTLAIARAEGGKRIKYKHTRNSLARIKDAREALGIVDSIVADFTAQTDEQTNTAVSDAQYDAILDASRPIPEDDGRARTMAENWQGTMRRLWTADPRVSPFRNTVFGVVQAFNTYEHHEKSVRGGGKDESAVRAVRMERNMERVLRGELESLDFGTVALAESVLAAS